MGWSVTFTCAICGKSKGEANHWWMAKLETEQEGAPAALTLLRWTRARSQNEDMYHLCGQGCALQAAERFMAEGSLDFTS